MKAGWEVKALGEVCSFENGDRGKNYPGRKAFVSEGVPFINAGHLTDEGIDWSNMNYIPLEHYQRIGSGKIQSGDILYCLRGSLGKFAHVDTDSLGAIASSLVIIRPKPSVLADYVGHYLASPLAQEMVEQFENGAAQPNLSGASLAKFQIPLPPLDEQKRIVEVLDAAFEGLSRARAHTETNLQNARELFERVSGGLLAAKTEGWAEKTLSQVCEKITDGTHQTPTYFEDGVIFLSSRNVTSRKIDWQNVKYIDQAQHIAMHKRVAPRKGDVLLAKNGTTGVAAMVDRDEVFDIYVSLAHLRPLEILEPEFLLYFLNSGVAKAQFNSRLKGQGVPNLHLQEIREVRMSFPNSRVEQMRIVEEIKELDAQAEGLQSHYCAKLADLDALRQALLQKAFAGELT